MVLTISRCPGHEERHDQDWWFSGQFQRRWWDWFGWQKFSSILEVWCWARLRHQGHYWTRAWSHCHFSATLPGNASSWPCILACIPATANAHELALTCAEGLYARVLVKFHMRHRSKRMWVSSGYFHDLAIKPERVWFSSSSCLSWVGVFNGLDHWQVGII